MSSLVDWALLAGLIVFVVGSVWHQSHEVMRLATAEATSEVSPRRTALVATKVWLGYVPLFAWLVLIFVRAGAAFSIEMVGAIAGWLLVGMLCLQAWLGMLGLAMRRRLKQGAAGQSATES